MRNISGGFVKKIKELILCAIIFFWGGGGSKIVSFMRKYGKIRQSQTGHRLQHNTAQK